MTIRNPKQEGSRLFDCKPQTGLCPMNCNQCFYNRPGAFYVDPALPHMPDPSELGPMDIMRVNSGHDSNINRELAITATARYPNRFFNTAIPRLDFPDPVVLTANPKEEETYTCPANLPDDIPANLMYVRLRVSPTNLELIRSAVIEWARRAMVPVVLTFMAYYDQEPPDKSKYEWKVRHINEYWCPTPAFKREVVADMKKTGGRLVSLCGTTESNYCRDCRHCEFLYWQTIRHMNEVKAQV